MSKKFLTFGILAVVLAGILVPSVTYALEVGGECSLAGGGIGVWDGEKCNAIVGKPGVKEGEDCNAEGGQKGIMRGGNCVVAKPGEFKDTTGAIDSAVNWLVKPLFEAVGMILISLSSLVLIIAGWMFDWIVNFSIIEMAENIGSTDPKGVGAAITDAWAVLRDIANMCFIFVLLYAAFKTMFDSNFTGFNKIVKDIILIALLINFSLFFSKVVIDASNIVAIGFYKSIVAQETINERGQVVASSTASSISSGYMKMLGLQTLFHDNILTKVPDYKQVMVVGFMSAALMLIAAVIFLIAGIMFAARFIILIFIMILSPIAFVAYIIPGQSKYFTQWKDALINQSFFAPLYFALTWVVFKVGSSLIGVLGSTVDAGGLSNVVSNPKSAMGLVVNYVLIIGLSIAALVISKKMAESTMGFKQITNTMGANRVAGAVGGVTLGGAAALSRRTVGAGASRLAQSQALSNWAGRSWIGEKVKAGTERTAKSSFDVRQTKSIGGAMQGTPLGSFGTGKAGGFEATLKAKTEKREKVAAGLRGDTAKEAYAARISRGRLTRGGSDNSTNTIFGTLGRHNRVVASRILNNQLTPLETQEQNLQNRESQLSQQLASLQNELATLQALNGGAGPAAGTDQANRLAVLQGPLTDRRSVAGVQDQLNTVQTRLPNVTAELNRIRDLIRTNGLVNTEGVGTSTPGQIHRMQQLQQQLTVINNAIAMNPGGQPSATQTARRNAINAQITALQNAMNATIAATQNPELGIRDARTGVVRGRRADEQNY